MRVRCGNELQRRTSLEFGCVVCRGSSHGTGTFHVGAFSNVGMQTTTVTTNVSVPNLTIDSNDDVLLDSGTTLTVTGH